MTEPILLTLPSDYYGQYTSQYVGTVSMRAMFADARWREKYHPARVFRGSYWGVTADTMVIGNDPPMVLSWDVWVVTKSANKGWKPLPGTPYTKYLPTYRGLPIACSDKKVEKWQAVSAGVLVEKPGAGERASALVGRSTGLETGQPETGDR